MRLFSMALKYVASTYVVVDRADDVEHSLENDGIGILPTCSSQIGWPRCKNLTDFYCYIFLTIT